MKKILINLFFLIFVSIISFAQNVDSCEFELHKELLYLSKGNSIENLKFDLSVLKECGKLDSIDQEFLLTPAMIGGILFQNASTKNKITYSMILNLLIKYSQSEEYKLLRDELLLDKSSSDHNIQKDKENKAFHFVDFISIENTLNEANKEKKKVLLYFSGKYCVNARKMETKVLNSPNISRIMFENYVPYIINVDDEINGTYYSELQNKYDSNYQPFFVILNSTGKLIKKIGYTLDLNEFQLFLE